MDKIASVPEKKNDNLSDSDSSFISGKFIILKLSLSVADSDDSDSEDERRKKPLQKDNQLMNTHEIASFQAGSKHSIAEIKFILGEYGSMVGSYVLNDKRR